MKTREHVHQASKHQKELQKARYDRGVREKSFTPGQLVMLYDHEAAGRRRRAPTGRDARRRSDDRLAAQGCRGCRRALRSHLQRLRSGRPARAATPRAALSAARSGPRSRSVVSALEPSCPQRPRRDRAQDLVRPAADRERRGAEDRRREQPLEQRLRAGSGSWGARRQIASTTSCSKRVPSSLTSAASAAGAWPSSSRRATDSDSARRPHQPATASPSDRLRALPGGAVLAQVLLGHQVARQPALGPRSLEGQL